LVDVAALEMARTVEEVELVTVEAVAAGERQFEDEDAGG
jgi:hypothetical protein